MDHIGCSRKCLRIYKLLLFAIRENVAYTVQQLAAIESIKVMAGYTKTSTIESGGNDRYPVR